MNRKGFTLIELLIGTVIMTIIILGALFLYSRSNKISATSSSSWRCRTTSGGRCSSFPASFA